MFKNVPQIKKNVVRMQVKHLLNVISITKLRYQKKNLPHGCFHNLATSAANYFRVRTKGEKQQRYKKLKHIRCFNIINIAECWWEIGCTSDGSVINQCWSMHYPVGTFSQMALFGLWAACYVSRTCEKVICKCQCFSLFDIQQWIPPWRDSAKCWLLRL